jgi:hypothetical protein
MTVAMLVATRPRPLPQPLRGASTAQEIKERPAEHLAREPCVLLLQARLLPGTLRVFKAFGCLRQKLVAPVIIEGLTNLMLVTQLRDRLALQALDNDYGVGVGVPLPAFHG